MEKIFHVILTLLFIFSSVHLNFAAEKDTKFNPTIRIGGSTTMLPIIADASVKFMEKYKTWDKVDPIFPKEQIIIYVTGGGSGFGIKSVSEGTNHIGMSSRDIKEKEKELLGKYKEFLISKDCIAFAVNKKNPLVKRENLTREEIAKIYSGEAKSFYDIDKSLPKKPIVVIMRDVAGGSTEIVQHEVLKDRSFTSKAIQVQSQGANLKKLETNIYAISYISSVVAMKNPSLKVFKYEGVMPTNENAISGIYKLTRPLILLTKHDTDPAVMKFIDYMLNEGQEIVEEHGYVPLKTIGKDPVKTKKTR
ncbi:MAG: phosphate ABC transporter substrate-binding protein [Syntrophorhabdaceae bacterium]|nr:phosphate ABC transporter substrate-binding protein [Syntrophorhabdaceae bacterium]